MKNSFTLFVLVLFLKLFFFSILKASQPFCEGHQNDENIQTKEIKKIEIKVDDYRSFQVNNIRILTDISMTIKRKFKRNFKSKFFIYFKGNVVCEFRGRVRQSGDFRDHIIYNNNEIKQSLDVSLSEGHINGITKFKLFLPETRVNNENELFFTEVVRHLGFIAPRSFFVDVSINDVPTKMLMQEKAVKELLEFHKRREGPILEGSEIIQSKFLSEIKQGSRKIEEQTREKFELGAKIQLAKMTNSNWAVKNYNNLDNSFRAISYLNKIYLLYINSYSNNKYIYDSLNYTLKNKLLSLGKKDYENQLERYNLLLMSAGAWHGILPRNRKFYWNSFSEVYEPIYYDGDVNFKVINLVHPVSSSIYQNTQRLIKDIDNIDKNILYKNLIKNGSEMSKQKMSNNINKIKFNLLKLETKYKEKKEESEYNYNLSYKPEIWNFFFNNSLKHYPKLKYVISNKINKLVTRSEFYYFLLCEKNENLCKENYKIFGIKNVNNLRNLIEMKYEDKNTVYQYLGTKDNFQLKPDDFYNFKKIKINNSTFYFEEGIKYKLEDNNLNIYQSKLEARAFFLGNEIKDLIIKFNGFQDKNFDIKNSENFPSNIKNLTGCISFIDVKFSNVEIYSSDGNCEDSLNLINSSGRIKNIKINNSVSDGLDIDFSNIKIDNIEVYNSKNDCLDVSYGEYLFNNLRLASCGDKGISIGEQSKTKIDNLLIKKTNVGVASKDSSIVAIDNANVSDIETCYSAYNKKQEFSGSRLKVTNSECKNYVNLKSIDKFSKINIINQN